MKRTIRLNEDTFHRLFLAEGRLTGQAKSRTYQVLKNGNSWVASVIDKPCTENGMDGSITYFDWVYRDITSEWCRQNIKLTPVIANILYNELGYRGATPNAEGINTFKEIVPLFEKDPKLGALPWDEAIKYSYEDLYNYFKPVLDEMEKENSEKKSKLQYGKSDYDIVPLRTFEEAEKFAWLTGGLNGEGRKICYADSRTSWNDYTNNGENSVYVCLKNGYKDIKPVDEDNAPFDNYGLSMIFVIVSPFGKLVVSNVRWNHAYVLQWNVRHRNQQERKADKILYDYEIAKIVNRNFDETFTGKYN